MQLSTNCMKYYRFIKNNKYKFILTFHYKIIIRFHNYLNINEDFKDYP